METGNINDSINATDWSILALLTDLSILLYRPIYLLNLDQNGLDYDNHSQLQFLPVFLQVLFVVPKACERQG